MNINEKITKIVKDFLPEIKTKSLKKLILK